MRVLITPTKSTSHKYLVHLFTKDLIKEVSELINRRRHADAMRLTISQGVFVRHVHRDEVSDVKADLMLSEDNARWDLTTL